MTYASIEEAWPENTLTIPMEKRQHPLHQKQMQRQVQQNNNQQMQYNQQQQMQYPEPKMKTERDQYQCSYGTHDCNQAFMQNQEYNNEKKKIAAGIQNYLPMSPNPQNYTYLPQYPWHPWAQQGYLMYGPDASKMWYNNPFEYDPNVANQILQKQMYSNVGAMTPTGPYEPRGFVPMSNKPYPPVWNNRKEHFSQESNNTQSMSNIEYRINAVRSEMIQFIFFLVALILILGISIVYMVCSNKTT
jgi:hypothetical protein